MHGKKIGMRLIFMAGEWLLGKKNYKILKALFLINFLKFEVSNFVITLAVL